MSDKPLKTVDNILANLAWQGKYTDAGQEVVNAGEVKQAKADLYQLMLSLVEDVHKYNPLDNRWYAEAKQELRTEFKAKLSEHFNGEGEHDV